jgi:hypothetical protein
MSAFLIIDRPVRVGSSHSRQGNRAAINRRTLALSLSLARSEKKLDQLSRLVVIFWQDLLPCKLKGGSQMDGVAKLQALMASDQPRMRILRIVRGLGLPDCWVAAGFVRNRVWDHLHQYPKSPLPTDIDVIWYSKQQAASELDVALETDLRSKDHALAWSVKNQARMHQRNADEPYGSAVDAMRYWPETATAIGVRLNEQGVIEVAAPFGLTDLFELVVQPTERFLKEKYPVYIDRIHAKKWQTTWPCLKVRL